MLNILFLGDIVGEPGRRAVIELLPRLREREVAEERAVALVERLDVVRGAWNDAESVSAGKRSGKGVAYRGRSRGAAAPACTRACGRRRSSVFLGMPGPPSE